MIKVSIVVPVYNTEKYIDDCINSILNQTFRDFELILINDGSSDSSGEICDEYAKKDSRIEVIHKENTGVASTRNLGIELSKGEYIGFIDSDDTIEKTMFEKMYNLGIDKEADIVACGFRQINFFTHLKKDFIRPLINHLDLRAEEIRIAYNDAINKKQNLGYPSMCNKLYRKKYLLENNLKVNNELTIAEDLCFNINAILKANRICGINETLYNYRRINNESIMNNIDTKKFYYRLDARKEIINSLKSNNIDTKDYIKYENCKTVGEYATQVKKILLSNEKLLYKIKEINKLLNEYQIHDATSNFDSSHLGKKGKLLTLLLKVYVLNLNGKVE